MLEDDGVLAGAQKILRGIPSTFLLHDGEPYWFNNPQYR